MSDWFAADGRRIESVAVEDRGLQYGDGLFETIAVRSGSLRLWALHMDRLQAGCAALGFRRPDSAQLHALVQSALQDSRAADDRCTAKIVLTAGPGERGYAREADIEPTVLIGVFRAQSIPAADYDTGVDTILCRTRLAGSSALAGLKTLNRLEQVLARSEVMKKQCFEGLTMDADGKVICGTMSNVFFVKNKTISTPSLQRCGVEGVMRRHIITTLQDHRVDTEYASPDATTLADVDEVFLSNSQFGILPVRRCGDVQWSVGQTTRRVMALLANNNVQECRR